MNDKTAKSETTIPAMTLQALSSKALNKQCNTAGLLTRSGHRSLPIGFNRQWQRIFDNLSCGTHSSGTVRDLHPIPFLISAKREPFAAAKIVLFTK